MTAAEGATSASQAEGSARHLWVTFLLAAFCALAYWASPARHMMDSEYSMLQGQAWLAGETRLDGYFRLPLDPSRHPALDPTRLPYQMEEVRGHVYYWYPPGATLLSLPFIAGGLALGVLPGGPAGEYYPRAELAIQAVAAAFFCAVFVGMIHYHGRRHLSPAWALGLALMFAFGTQLWGTLSRVLHSHDPGIVVLMFVACRLWMAPAGASRRWLAVLGAATASLYVIRPSFAPDICLVSGFVLLRERQRFGWFLGGLALVGACFCAYSLATFGTLLPSYYRASEILARVAETRQWGWGDRAFGLLFSPSRGLAVYAPLTLVVAIAAAIRWRSLGDSGITMLAGAAVLAKLALLSMAPFWHGGLGFGPRLQSDILPWVAILAILVAKDGARWARAAMVAVLPWGVLVQAQGALTLDTMRWESWPDDVTKRDIVWDWSNPQCLSGVLPPPPPTLVAPLPPDGVLPMGASEGAPFRAIGWNTPERGVSYTVLRRAYVFFATDARGKARLEIEGFAFPSTPPMPQRCRVRLNGVSLGELVRPVPGGGATALEIPENCLQPVNRLELEFPDAVTPAAFKEHRFPPQIGWGVSSIAVRIGAVQQP